MLTASPRGANWMRAVLDGGTPFVGIVLNHDKGVERGPNWPSKWIKSA